MKIIGAVLACAGIFAASGTADGAEEEKDFPTEIRGRRVELFSKIYGAEFGYPQAVREIYLVQHPVDGGDRKGRALQVVLHSSGHGAQRALLCTRTPGNHDIYRAPDDFFALYVNCTLARGTDWWWGAQEYGGFGLSPCEKRVMATIEEVVSRYGIDRERIYLCGNSMGGSGVLGIGLRHGDVFAAIKANVPALVKHATERMGWDTNLNANAAADLSVLRDPPLLIDYSAPNDKWSAGREHVVAMMKARKYPWMLFWGAFGHANDDAKMLAQNDIIHSFEWTRVRKSDVLPAFTCATSDDAPPWPDRLDSKAPGQINAFFRWSDGKATADSVSLKLFLADLKSRHFTVPAAATADVTLRRLGAFKVKAGDTVDWEYAGRSGKVSIGADALVTIARLVVTGTPRTLTVKKAGAARRSCLDDQVQAHGIATKTTKATQGE